MLSKDSVAFQSFTEDMKMVDLKCTTTFLLGITKEVMMPRSPPSYTNF